MNAHMFAYLKALPELDDGLPAPHVIGVTGLPILERLEAALSNARSKKWPEFRKNIEECRILVDGEDLFQAIANYGRRMKEDSIRNETTHPSPIGFVSSLLLPYHSSVSPVTIATYIGRRRLQIKREMRMMTSGTASRPSTLDMEVKSDHLSLSVGAVRRKTPRWIAGELPTVASHVIVIREITYEVLPSSPPITVTKIGRASCR